MAAELEGKRKGRWFESLQHTYWATESFPARAIKISSEREGGERGKGGVNENGVGKIALLPIGPRCSTRNGRGGGGVAEEARADAGSGSQARKMFCSWKGRKRERGRRKKRSLISPASEGQYLLLYLSRIVSLDREKKKKRGGGGKGKERRGRERRSGER